MKEAIRRCLTNNIGKDKNLLICRSAEQMTGQILPESTLESSCHSRLQKADQPAGPAVQKRDTSRYALIRLRFSLRFSLRLEVILMSLYLSFFLAIGVQVMVTSPALAKGNAGAPDPQGYVLYTSGLCQSWTHEEVPQEWKDAGLCDASVGQSFAQPGNGNCQQGWLAEMTETGQQECVLTVVSIRSECPVGFALDAGRCDYEPVGRIGWQVGFCQSFTTGQVPPEWINNHVCDINPVPDPQQTFVQPSSSGPCQQNFIKTMTRAGQEECVLIVPTFKSACPIGFALKDGWCEYVPQNSGGWQVGFCKSWSSDEVPVEWVNRHVCDIDPVPDPETTFVVQPSSNGSCQQNWVSTMSQTGQQECILTVPAFKNACPIGFTLDGGLCEYVPQNGAHWQVGFCHAFTSDEIPTAWIDNHVCDTNPVPDPEQTFTSAGPCQPGWIATTAETTDVQCLLTIPSVRGLCPTGFTLDAHRCDYVPQNKTTWAVGLCTSFSSDEIPAVWIDHHVCDVNPIPNPETTFIRGVPCRENWIETTDASGQVECILTIPSVRGLCPSGFALDSAKCDYVPQNKTTWMVGLCKSFSSDAVPVEWITNHVCDINPVPDPEQTFIKEEPCLDNWIRTAAEGGNVPKCALTVPAIRGVCPIDFALDEARCAYIPQQMVGWQFPCSDRTDGRPKEKAIANDWLSGDSPDTQTVTSDATVTDGTTGGRFVHTFAADTYGLQSVQEIFSYMLGLAFVLVTPIVILIGYQLLLAASSFRHAGVLEGLSRVLLGGMAIGVSFQLVTMLISFANVMNSAIVSLHGMISYPVSSANYMLAGANEPVTSYRGLVMPMSRWGCAANDFIGILGTKFLKEQVATWFPVIGNLAPLATTVTNGTDLVSRLTELARLILSVILWVQAVVRIGLLNCYILTCPLAFACWAFPGGLGQQVIRQWTRGFLSVLFLQVAQLFLITTLPLVLPTFPSLAGDNGIMYVLLTQLPPLLVLWLTVMVPNFVGVTATRAIGMTGVMAGGIVGAVGAAAGRLG
jgi:hypothetical protein